MTTDQGVCVASKRKGGVAPYVALLVALLIFVPPFREAVLGWGAQLVDSLKDLTPFRP
ncbi:hypothetical protein [Umezawaea sp.]|uniref:hypothetical protein n=1 Tax=Umezawaea sp. TaxID=1955258 RepID=UPI002ED58068